MTLGKRIESVIEEKGLNYRSLSKIIPYSDVQIRRICLGESSPKVDFIQHLCNVFPELDVVWLLTGDKKEKLPLPDKNQKMEVEVFSKIIFDNWDTLMKDRLFKSLFESKAAAWALKLKRDNE